MYLILKCIRYPRYQMTSERKEITSYVHIDSRMREKNTSMILGDSYATSSNPIIFRNNSRKIYVNFPKNIFSVGDKIIFQNITRPKSILNNIITFKKNSKYIRILHNSHNMTYAPIIDTKNDLLFENIEYVDDLPINFNKTSDIPDVFNKYYKLRNQPIDFFVNLSNIIGYTQNYLGNIPLNYINSRHRIYLIYIKNQDGYVSDPNSYLIKLENISSINYKDGHKINNTSFIEYEHIYGINVSEFNSKLGTYFHIDEVDDDGFYTTINTNALIPARYARYGGDQIYIQKVMDVIRGYPSPSEYAITLPRTFTDVNKIRVINSIFPNSQRVINQTNNKLYWRNISNINHIYQLEINPGNYTPETLSNEIRKKFKSSHLGDLNHRSISINIDPQTDIVTFTSFITHQVNSENNSVLIAYNDSIIVEINNFNNKDVDVFILSDLSENTLDILYKLSKRHTVINQYIAKRDTDTPMILDFINKENKIVKKYHNIETNIKIPYINSKTDQIYIKNHGLKKKIIYITDKFSKNEINIYIIDIVDDSILSINLITRNIIIFIDDFVVSNIDNIYDDINIFPINDIKSVLTINHPDHMRQIGDTISIANSISVNGIPENKINKSHLVNEIINDSSYNILLEPYTPIQIIESVRQYISLTYHDKIQLLFDKSGTLGSIINFRNVGDKNSITPFSHIIKNTDPYLSQIDTKIDNQIFPKINLNGASYFYLCCDNVDLIHNTAPVENVLTIINLENPGKIEYNSFVNINIPLINKIRSLKELHFIMKNSDGTLVEFNNMDHSFTLEINHEI